METNKQTNNKRSNKNNFFFSTILLDSLTCFYLWQIEHICKNLSSYSSFAFAVLHNSVSASPGERPENSNGHWRYIFKDKLSTKELMLIYIVPSFCPHSNPAKLIRLSNSDWPPKKASWQWCFNQALPGLSPTPQPPYHPGSYWQQDTVFRHISIFWGFGAHLQIDLHLHKD